MKHRGRVRAIGLLVAAATACSRAPDAADAGNAADNAGQAKRSAPGILGAQQKPLGPEAPVTLVERDIVELQERIYCLETLRGQCRVTTGILLRGRVVPRQIEDGSVVEAIETAPGGMAGEVTHLHFNLQPQRAADLDGMVGEILQHLYSQYAAFDGHWLRTVVLERGARHTPGHYFARVSLFNPHHQYPPAAHLAKGIKWVQLDDEGIPATGILLQDGGTFGLKLADIPLSQPFR